MTSQKDHPIVDVLRRGPRAWDEWFQENRAPMMQFRGAVFEDLDLGWWKVSHLDLRNTKFRRVDLNGAFLASSQLDGALFEHVDLGGTALMYSNFRDSRFLSCDLNGADLTRADLTGATLERCSLVKAHLVETVLKGSIIRSCSVYGSAVWNVDTTGSVQEDLRITPLEVTRISVDDLETAQFLHLLITNKKLRRIIDTVTSKVVLLLGRFTQDRKAVLDSIRVRLRELNYIPVMFDFEKPEHRDTLETVTLLARLARFVIADITDPRSIPQELTAVVRDLPSVPIVPLLGRGASPWGMWDAIRPYPWVLPLHTYDSGVSLLAELPKLLEKAEAAAKCASTK